jgi:hypothetical protein
VAFSVDFYTGNDITTANFDRNRAALTGVRIKF